MTTTHLDDLVATLVDLNDKIAHLDAERAAIKAAIIDTGVAEHAAHGVTVTVRPPSRRFNLDRAWTMLAPEQQALCVAPDPKKVRAQLPPAVLDACMDDGTGNPVVSVK